MDPTSFVWALLLGGGGVGLGLLLALVYSALRGKAKPELERRQVRFRLGFAGGILGLLGAQFAHPLRPPQAQPRAAALLDAELRTLLEQGAVADKLLTKSQPGALAELRARLPASAVYLSGRDLELWADVRLAIGRASPKACAKLWTGGDDPAAALALETLSDDELREWAEMSARGLALSLEGKPPPEVSPDALARGFSAVIERLPPDLRQTFRTDAANPLVRESDACQLFLRLFSGARELPQPLQGELLRALAARSAPRAPAPAAVPAAPSAP